MLQGNGDGTFQPAVTYDSGEGYESSVTVADVNSDGKLDVLTANLDSNTIGVVLGNGDGTFHPVVKYTTSGNYARSVAVTDLNGDGKSDLVVAVGFDDTGLNGSVDVLLGNGDGTFQPALIFGSGGVQTMFSVAAADLNGDGRPDVVASLYSGAGVLLNNSPDTTRPVITVFATAEVLRLPRRKIVRIEVSGTITDTGSGVNLNSLAFVVKDEDGKVQQTGAISLGAGGKYSFTVLLPVSRRVSHRYAVTVRATDNAGNRASKTRVVTVPHDRGDEDD